MKCPIGIDSTNRAGIAGKVTTINYIVANFPGKFKYKENDSMYEIIDESLKLASCGIAELTYEQASSFLSKWEDGAKLGSLTLFFDEKSEYLVINRDNPDYEFYVKLAKTYLCLSKKEKRAFREKFGQRHRQTFEVMDNFKVHSHVQNNLKMIEHQSCFVTEDQVAKNVLIRLEEQKIPTCFLMSQAYSYGVMNGKRMERAKRKGGAL